MTGQPDPQLPPSPISRLATAAASVHELFRSYVDAGFTEAQALALIKVALCAKCAADRGDPPPPTR